MAKKKTGKEKPAVKRVPEVREEIKEDVVNAGDKVIPETESDKKPEEPKEIPEKEEVKEPVSEKPKVSLQVFEKLSGMKFDQIAGFKQYAKREGLEPLTVLDWRKAFQKFMGKPTN